MIVEDHRLTIHEFLTFWNYYGTCQKILSDELNMRQTALKFVPQLLGDKQKHHRIEICSDLKEMFQNDPEFLS